MGVVDGAGDSVRRDCNGGGTGADSVALVLAVVDGERLEYSARRAVVADIEVNISAGSNGGSGEGKESQSDEGAHA
jgi:hypothetical protein